MGFTYDYSTGKLTLDFHLVKYNEICRLRGLAARVGGPACSQCPFNGGVHTIFKDPHDMLTFIVCKHKDAEHSGEGYWSALDNIRERCLTEALSAL